MINESKHRELQRKNTLIALVRHYLKSFNGTLKPADGLDDYQCGADAGYPLRGGNGPRSQDPLDDRVRHSAGDNRTRKGVKYSQPLIIDGKQVVNVIHYPEGSGITSSRRKVSIPTEAGIDHALAILKDRGEEL